MKRRTVIIGAGGLLAAGVGIAGSESSVLSGAPTELSSTTSSTAEFSFSQNGIKTIDWQKKSGGEAWLKATYESTPPDLYRLHKPNGKAVWEVDSPSGDGNKRAFGLPITASGDWELVVSQGGSDASLLLPVSNQYAIDTFGLQGDTLVLEVTNDTKSPNYIEYFRVTHKQTGRGKEFQINQPLMPGETYTLEKQYPFDYYKDVEIWIVSSSQVEVQTETKDFV